MPGPVILAGGSPVTVALDWRPGLLAPGEAIAGDLGWTVRPAGALRATALDHDGRRSWAALEGGVPGAVYAVTSRVRTTDARVLSRAIEVRVMRAPQARCEG